MDGRVTQAVRNFSTVSSRPSAGATSGTTYREICTQRYVPARHRLLRAAGPLPRRARAAPAGPPGILHHSTRTPTRPDGEPRSFQLQPGRHEATSIRAVRGPSPASDVTPIEPGDAQSRGRLRAVEEERAVSQNARSASASLLVGTLLEHVFCLHTAEAAGSIPAAPTTRFRRSAGIRSVSSPLWSLGFRSSGSKRAAAGLGACRAVARSNPATKEASRYGSATGPGFTGSLR